MNDDGSVTVVEATVVVLFVAAAAVAVLLGAALIPTEDVGPVKEHAKHQDVEAVRLWSLLAVMAQRDREEDKYS